ncbi:MAG: ribosomal L7Ae/L30e/S12e/Gadd45 family protein [Clostridia bacterium]|nr:ribosomal L7Ae/L30e/S12e/Gadd45 family protein [Clostridia bacterium]
MNDSALSLLGLCRKAGKLSLGHDACKAALNAGTASLCVICTDASARLREEISSLAVKAEVKIFDVNYTMIDIKNATGFKAAVFTVDDEGFAKTLINKFNDNKSGKERGL